MCTAGTSASRSRAASSRDAATLAQKATVRAPAARRIHMATPASSSALPSALAPLGRTNGAKTRGVTWRAWRSGTELRTNRARWGWKGAGAGHTR